MAEDKKKRSDFQVEWEDTYKVKLDNLKQISEERLAWLSTFNFGSDTGGEGDPSASSGGAAGLTAGNTNEEKTWNFFASKGFTQAGVAGIMGNLQQESRFSTTIKNPSSGATGLCQWLGGRLTGLKSFAKEQGQPWDSIELQLEWLWKELNGGDSTTKSILDKRFGGIDKALKNATDVRSAVIAFEQSFERAGSNEKAYDNRTKFANEFLEQFGSGSASSVATETVGSGSGGGGSLPGGLKAATMVNGKVIPPTGSGYNATIAKARRSSGFKGYVTLESSKYYSNLSGCTMMVAPEFKPFVDLIHENLRAKNLLKNGKMPVNSAYRPTLDGAVDNGAHGWGAAIDIGTFGVKDALAKADLCWALGFRRVAVGGSLTAGRGFVHVDISPAASWNYAPYPKYTGPTSWSSYR
jgi:hypothetical protein